MAKQLKIRKIYLGPGSMGSLSQVETQRRIKATFARIESKLAFRFEWVPSSGLSNRRILFLDNAGMAAMRRDRDPVLGQTKAGTIWLNSERPWPKSVAVVQGAVMHEWGHSEGLSHSADETSIMHPNLKVYFPSGKDWEAWIKRFGAAVQSNKTGT